MPSLIIRWLDNKKELKRISMWQYCSDMHPFTCGNSSNHALLEGFVSIQKRVILRCRDCGYMQELPWYFYKVAHRLYP